RELLRRVDPNNALDEEFKISYFERGLLPQYKVHTKATDVETLDEAIEVARKWERSYRDAAPHTIFGMFQDPSVAVAQKTQTEEFQKTIAHLTEQITKMATLQNQAAKPKPQSNNGNQSNQKQNFSGNNNNNPRNITCYNCGQLGHTSRFCQMSRQQQNYNRPPNYEPPPQF